MGPFYFTKITFDSGKIASGDCLEYLRRKVKKISAFNFNTCMRRKNDILLKSAFEEAFSDLLRFFFKDADVIFDIAKGFEFMDKELSELFPEVEKNGGSRFVDMLIKTYLKNGSEEWMLVHLEIQDKNDRHFTKRMFQYFYRIYDRYDVRITALAVFTGNYIPSKANYFNHNFLGTKITYEYNSYHIREHTEEQLLAMDNPFALIVLAAQKALLIDKIPEEELGQQRLLIARTMIQSKKYDSEQIHRFLFFLKTFVYIQNPEINFNFDKEVESLTKNSSAMGIIETIKMITREEGIEEGREQEKINFVNNLLLNTDFDISKIAALSGTSIEYVKKTQNSLKK